MRVNHNISAMITQNALGKVQGKGDKAMQKLSTGMRINSAADDAAGMAISNKLRTQVNGLKMASRNSLDGISLVQTAEGALNEVQSMLQRMRELAIQASNDTMQAEDRAAIQAEVSQLLIEIDDTSKKTEFNKIKLLNGDCSRATASSNSNMAVCSYTSNGIVAGEMDYKLISTGTQATVTSKGADFNTATDSTGNLVTNYAGKLTINGEIVEIKETDSVNDIVNAMKDLCDRAGIEIVVKGGKTWTEWRDGAPGAELMFVTKETGSDQKIDIACDNTVLLNALGFYSEGKDKNTFDRGSDAVVDNVTYNGKNVLASCRGNEITITGDAGQTVRINLQTYIDDHTGEFRMPTDTKGNYLVVDPQTGTINEGKGIATNASNEAINYTAVGTTLSPASLHTSGHVLEYEIVKGKEIDGSTIFSSVAAADTFEVKIGTKNYTFTGAASLSALSTQIKNATGCDVSVVGTDLTIITDENVSIKKGADTESGTAIDKAIATRLYRADGTSVSLSGKDVIGSFDNVTPPTKITFTADLGQGGALDFNLTTNTYTALTIDSYTAANGTVTTPASPTTGLLNKGTGAITNSAAAAPLQNVTFYAPTDTCDMSLNLLDFGSLVMHVGPNENMTLNIEIPSITSDGLRLSNINMRSREGAEAAIPMVDEALTRLSDIRARLGAYQNRLEYTISNLDKTQENATASLSRIEDTDMATEMTEYTQQNVLSQAGISILSQANQRPQQILQLLQ